MNHNFKEYTTSAAFSLTLTSPMVRQLCMVYCRSDYWNDRYGFMATAALIRRGLISLDRNIINSPCRYKLTNAGKLIVELLKEADLFEEYEEKYKAN